MSRKKIVTLIVIFIFILFGFLFYNINSRAKKTMFLNIYECSENICKNETFELKTDEDCKEIKDKEIYEICLYLHNDRKLCDENIKIQCITLHAIKNNDKRICNEIPDSRDFCIEKVDKRSLGFVKTFNYSSYSIFNFFVI
jgi:hypothetical protein